MKLLQHAIADGSLVLDLDARDLRSVFRHVVELLAERGLLHADRRKEVEEALLERETLGSTAIGHAMAVPHAYLDCFERPTIVFVRLARPVNLGAPDGIPTRYVFLLLGPPGRAAEHLDTLANIARLMSDSEFRYDAGRVRTGEELLAALIRFDERMAPVPAPKVAEVSEGLTYTGRLCGGILADMRRRLPHYAADFRDGLHTKSVSSTLFLFFACLAPAVTFGGIMAELTGGQIGAVEMMLATTIGGITFAFFGGQPLIILGGIGPHLIFTAILYELCINVWGESRGAELFLPVLAWVGCWAGLMLIVMAATDASCLIRLVTRFTDEIFAALVSLIFIYYAFVGLAHQFSDLEEARHHATAVLSLLLALGTFYIAMSLSRMRRSRYLLPWMRQFLADFGPAIAMAAMTLVAVWLRDVDLKELPVPEQFEPTLRSPDGSTSRAWLLNPLTAPRWVWVASIVPAMLVAVLTYVVQNVTARLVNNRDHRLEKGEAYHLDLVIVGFLFIVCSMLGLPWLVAATVRSLNHLRSLATVEEVVLATGDCRERVLHVRETRVPAVVIHLLIGLSLLLLPLLKIVPMPVLYGLFLYMGVVSMAGNQFLERMSLWLMDSNLYPATHYIRRVPIGTIHRFTALQLGCLAVLIAVEVSPIAILFPLVLVLTVPVRAWAGRFFAPEHLVALDAEEEPDEEIERRAE